MTNDSKKRGYLTALGRAATWLFASTASMYGVAVIAIVAITLVYLWPFRWLSAEGEGMVLLETPQIFTRGRLVNDRALEQAWLEEQLARTRTLLEADRFAKPDSIRFARRSLSLSLRSGDPNQGLLAAPPAQMDEETRKKLATVSIMASPHEQFEDAARYRATIRNYLMSTVLDDRHDIEGNTIYRFNFNATVLPPKGSANVAMVVVHLRETDPAAKKQVELENTYVELLYDWRTKLQETLDALIADRMATVEEFDFPLEPVENNVFNKWLIDQTRAELSALLGIERASVADAFLDRLQADYTNLTRDIERKNIARQFTGALAPVLKESPAPHQLLDYVIDKCNRERFDPNQLIHPSKSTGKLPPLQCRQPASSLVTRIEILDSIKLLRTKPQVAKRCEEPDQLSQLIIGVSLPTADRSRSACALAGHELNRQRSFAIAQKRRTDIVAAFEADYMIARKPKSQRNRLPSDPPIEANLGMFFKVLPPPPCGPGACKPIIDFTAKDVTDSARAVIKMIAPTTRVFTYSVTPSKFVQRSEARQRSDHDVGAVASGPGNPNISGHTSSSAETVGLEAEPLVIGFGDWGTTSHEMTKFGWALFPKASVDGESARQQAPENYSVSAVVSLPGWWKTAHFVVETCWVSEAEAKRKRDPSCHGRSPFEHRIFDVRLPGDAWELMQHLRFEVIRTPYLERPLGPHPVEIGRKASVMIRGGRLWRSPVVKFGNQQADRIEVLPDMQGIIAHFKCLEPLPGIPTDQPVQAPVHVITSEGRTQFPFAVIVNPFSPLGGEKPEDVCWLKPKKDGES